MGARGPPRRRTRAMAEPSESAASAASPSASGGAVASVKALLDAPVRIALMDGRVLVGKFSCFDKQRNVLLSEVWEHRFADGGTAPSPPRAPDFERNLGLVLVPRQHIAAVHALDEDDFS